jgi:hypothetical protein
MLNKYQIWIEGYAATGEHGTAQYHGEYEGETFGEACRNMMRDKKWPQDHYDSNHNTYWACRFFDNETDARKSYG